MNFDVFFYEAFEEEEEFLKKFLPSHIVAGFTWKTIQEAKHQNVPAGIISTRTQSIFPELWKDSLDAIISRSTGYDHLLAYYDTTHTSAHLGYLPLYCSRAVAEQAMLFWTALMRKLPQQTTHFKKFYRDGLTGMELKGKSIVVYGVGNIGYEIIKIAQGLGMNAFGVDIVKRHPDVKYVTPQEGVNHADIIISAMNLTSENRNYFNAEFFRNVKPHLIFVNISRGEISPSTEILRALKSHFIAAAALDVFDEEKKLSVSLRSGLISEDPQIIAVQRLLKMQNVILTPHNAFNTQESVERKCKQTVEQLEFFLEHKKFKWPVQYENK